MEKSKGLMEGLLAVLSASSSVDTKEEETEALIGQLYRTQDYLDCLPVHQIVMDKLEADDVIAWIAKKASISSAKKCTIVSSDKDFLQLIDDTVEVYAPIKKKIFTQDNIFDELKVLPENYNLVKALVGDNSDNLQGVKGLGIKTIISEFPKLLTEITNLEYIYKTAEEKLEGKKIFAKIIHNWDRVETNFKLMDLHITALDDKEKQVVIDTLSSKVPELQTGAFLRHLDQDKIEGITKNTEGWLENFRPLTLLR